MTAEQQIQLALALPLCGAVLVLLLGKWPNAREAGSLTAASHNRKCVEAALEAAVNQLDSGQVAALLN